MRTNSYCTSTSVPRVLPGGLAAGFRRWTSRPHPRAPMARPGGPGAAARDTWRQPSPSRSWSPACSWRHIMCSPARRASPSMSRRFPTPACARPSQPPTGMATASSRPMRPRRSRTSPSRMPSGSVAWAPCSRTSPASASSRAAIPWSTCRTRSASRPSRARAARSSRRSCCRRPHRSPASTSRTRGWAPSTLRGSTA